MLVQCWTGVVLGKHSFKLWVVFLNSQHSLINDLANFSLFGIGLKMWPAGLLGHPEDVSSGVLVTVFGIGVLFLLQLGVPFFKGVGNVLKKDQPKDDVLVLGSVHMAAEFVCGRP